LWITQKNPYRTNFLEEDSVKNGEKETKRRYGIVNFEKRKHPRFSVDLPIEYSRTDFSFQHGRVINASEGGLLVYLPEQMEIGQHLKLKLFFTSGSEMNTIETLVKVVWIDIHLGKDLGDYRTGVRFVDISLEDLNNLKNFFRSLSG
jgi:c-di-GMP-binding flagellar brake protein YcgR